MNDKTDLPFWLTQEIVQVTKSAESAQEQYEQQLGEYNLHEDIKGPWEDAYFSRAYYPNLVYYAVPKNCSNSIKSMLETKSGKWKKCGKGVMVPSKAKANPIPGSNLVPIGKPNVNPFARTKILARHNFYDKEKFFSFAFVRNPYDRFYSTFKMLATEWTVKNLPRKRYVNKLDDFVHAVCNKHFGDNHTRKQSSFIPVDIDPHVNFIGRYENFENDWFTLQEKINHKFVDKVVKRQNTSYQEMIRNGVDIEPPKVMTSKSLKMLQEFYHDDFVNFGYNFDDLGDFKIT